MKFVIAVICLMGLVAGQSNEKECKTPWTSFISKIGMEAMKMGKMMIHMKMKGTCLNLKMKKDDMKKIKGCAKDTVSSVMNTLGSNSFGHTDLVKAFKRFMTCKMEKLADIDLDDGLDKEEFRNKCLQKIYEIAQDTETNDIMFNALMDCTEKHITGASGDAAFRELIKTKSCMLSQVLTACDQNNDEPGMIMKMAKAFLTLMDDPKCVAPIGPEFMADPARDCLMDANNAWRMDHTHPERFSLNSNNGEDNIVVTFTFLKNYIMDILFKCCNCIGLKLGALKQVGNNIFVSEANKLQFVLNLNWANMTERDNLVSLCARCVPKRNDRKLKALNNVIERMEPGSEEQKCLVHNKLMIYKMKVDECMCEEYIETCGLNNDISKMMHPILNYDLMNMVRRDFVSKGGVDAVKHMMGVLHSKMMDMGMDMDM